MQGRSNRIAADDVEAGGGGSGGGTTSANKTKQPMRVVLKSMIKENLLVFLLVVALVVGVVLGVLLRLRPEKYSTREKMMIKFPGEILMNMLKVLILPLIVSSLITGMTSLEVKAGGKVGLSALVYYLCTTFVAVIMGIVLVVSIRPGEHGQSPTETKTFRQVEPYDTFVDLIRQMFPDNIIEVAFQKTLTRLREINPDATPPPGSNKTVEKQLEPYLKKTSGMNMLGIVTMSLAVSIAMNVMGDRANLLRAFFNSVTELTMLLIQAVIWYSPIGIVFLIVKELVGMEDPQKMFQSLSYYFLTVMLGLLFHGFVSLPFLYFAVCRSNPYRFMKGVMQALVTAIGTGSSLATLPITMRNLEENNRVDPRVIGFVAPVGATINMDGTALYEAVAVIFIAQVEGHHLDIGEIIVVCFTATIAAIGAAGVPQAGLVTMVIVLTAVGLPTDKIGLILAIDWLLDRFRTSLNVLGDCYGAGIVQHLCRADLQRSRIKANFHMGAEYELSEVQP